MDNQHRAITGYRELSPAEVECMNALKAKGAEVGKLLDQLVEMAKGLPDPDRAEAGRYAALARTNIQQGFMWAIRSVARPTTFC